MSDKKACVVCGSGLVWSSELRLWVCINEECGASEKSIRVALAEAEEKRIRNGVRS